MTAYTDRLAQKASRDSGTQKPGEVDESLLVGLGQRKQSGASPKTGPGQMLAYTNMALKVQNELEEAKGKLKEYEGSLMVRAIDPKSIAPSMWANRHETSFLSAEFEALKAEIGEAGGNVQPIKVRPVVPGSKGEGVAFEVVYGHRRHRACLELGLDVLAMVEEVDDAQLFIEMDRENRSRENLSPYEQGVMYNQALEKGLFSSMRQLAKSVGSDSGNVSRYVRLAKFPEDVLAVFASPCDIQVRWAVVIEEQLQNDPKGILSRAQALRQATVDQPDLEVSAADLFARLTTLVGESKTDTIKTPIKLDGKVLGAITRKANGALSIDLKKGFANADKVKLVELITKAIQNSD